MTVSTNSTDRYTIRTASADGDKFSVHDERDLLEPGKRIASCPDEVSALIVTTALNKQYSIAMMIGPASLRIKRKVGVA